MKNVRIVGGADASSVKVIDADTGLPIAGIKELRLTIKAGDPAVCEAVLQFRVMSLNQAAEMVKFDVEPVPGVVINAPLVVGSRLVDVPPAVPNAGGVAAVHITESDGSLAATDVRCRGSIVLGSGCKKCSRCLEDIAQGKTPIWPEVRK